MYLNDDFSDPMVEEVLTDAADNFFGSRKQVDNMIGLFHSYLEALREKETRVDQRAGLLNYLLPDNGTVTGFYESLGIENPQVFTEARISERFLPWSIPVAFTLRGKFIRLVLWAYEELQHESDEYLNGKTYSENSVHRFVEEDVYYKLLINMCDLVNQKIRSVNEISALSVLQFARKFNSGIETRENITGGTTFGGSGINEKLAYQLIDFDSTGVKQYPELPKPAKAESVIIRFCKKIYPDNKDHIKERISDLKEKIEKEHSRIEANVHNQAVTGR